MHKPVEEQGVQPQWDSVFCCHRCDVGSQAPKVLHVISLLTHLPFHRRKFGVPCGSHKLSGLVPISSAGLSGQKSLGEFPGDITMLEPVPMTLLFCDLVGKRECKCLALCTPLVPSPKEYFADVLSASRKGQVEAAQ